jgi:DNA replication protein DnaC
MPKLLLIDEVGYLPFSREEASHFSRSSLNGTSAAPCSYEQSPPRAVGHNVRWRRNDDGMLDRLLHHAHVAMVTRESFRLRKRKRAVSSSRRPKPIGRWGRFKPGILCQGG